MFDPVAKIAASLRIDHRDRGGDDDAGGGTDRRRQVTVATVEVKPGLTRTLDLTLLTGQTHAGTAELALTPTVTPWTTQVVSAPSCEQ